MHIMASWVMQNGGVLILPLAAGTLEDYVTRHGWADMLIIREKTELVIGPLYQVADGVQVKNQF